MTYQPPSPSELHLRILGVETSLAQKVGTEAYLEFRKANDEKIEDIEKRLEADLRWRRQIVLLISVAAFSSLLSLIITFVFFVLNRLPVPG